MTSANSTDLPTADSVTVRIYSAGGHHGRVLVHLDEKELSSASLQIGDDVVLDIRGAVVRGVISKDDGGVWLGTQPLRREWSHQRITDALAAVGIKNPSKLSASIVARNGVTIPVSDPERLQRHMAAIDIVGLDQFSTTGNRCPAKVQRTVSDYKRCPAVIRAARHSAAGRCELCAQDAPFRQGDGTPFLEVHHVVTLAEGGSDTIDNAAALCPNCHRLLHYAADVERKSAADRLKANLARKLCPTQ